MPVHPEEYHPYGVCLMFKACQDSATVRANLWAIQERSYDIGRRAGENCRPSTEANTGQANTPHQPPAFRGLAGCDGSDSIPTE
jgi:hypothetical protein